MPEKGKGKPAKASGSGSGTKSTGQRENPLEHPVFTFSQPRENPLDRPVLGFIAPRPGPQAQSVRHLDLTRHVLHEEHLESVIAFGRKVDWANGALISVRPADVALAERLASGLRGALGPAAPRVRSK